MMTFAEKLQMAASAVAFALFVAAAFAWLA